MSVHWRALLALLPLFLAFTWTSPACVPSQTILLSLGECEILSPGQSDVHSWGARVGVVNSGDLCLVPSTATGHSFFTREDICSDSQLNVTTAEVMSHPQCRSRRGGYLPSSFKGGKLDGLEGAEPGWIALNNKIKEAVDATLTFFGQQVTMRVGLITEGQQSTASHLGLDEGSVLLQTLKNKGLIAARSFSLNVGSQSAEFPRRGSLILGGFDQASFASSSFYQEKVATKPIANRHCPLQVYVSEIRLQGEVGDGKGNSTKIDKTVISEDDNDYFCIEPYDNLFRLPSSPGTTVKDTFKAIPGFSAGPVDSSQYKDKLFNLEPGLVYPASAGRFNGTMRVTINRTLTVEIPAHELWRPLRGLNTAGDIVTDDRYNELQIYALESNADAPVLGKAFLSQVMLFVDYDHSPPIFRLTPQTADEQSSSSSSSSIISSVYCPPNPGLTPTEKGLIGVGSVLGVMVLAILLYLLRWLYRWWQAKRARKEAEAAGVNGTTEAAGGQTLGGTGAGGGQHLQGRNIAGQTATEPGVAQRPPPLVRGGRRSVQGQAGIR